jgi:hypothetical protein
MESAPVGFRFGEESAEEIFVVASFDCKSGDGVK